MTGREKLEAIKLKHLPKGSDAWATCGDKTLLEITRAKLLRYLLQLDGKSQPNSPLPDPDDIEDACLYLSELLVRYNPPPPAWEPNYKDTSPHLSLDQGA